CRRARGGRRCAGRRAGRLGLVPAVVTTAGGEGEGEGGGGGEAGDRDASSRTKLQLLVLCVRVRGRYPYRDSTRSNRQRCPATQATGQRRLPSGSARDRLLS